MKKALSINGFIIFLGAVIILIAGCGGDDNGTNSSSGAISTGNLPNGLIVDHTSPSGFADIPDTVIEQVVASQKVFHGCTSYGRQISLGMFVLGEENSQLYYLRDGLYYADYNDDLGEEGDTSWTIITRMGLDNPSNQINVIMWSWGSGVSNNTKAGISKYLTTMSALEAEYPQIRFIYMTGHCDGSGDAGNLRARNNQIRQYCIGNKKILYDFADIASYNPDNVFFPDASDSCVWCDDWCDQYDCSDCVSCSHSHCLDCYLKGQAFWWMLARMSGWDVE
ncbi:MAG: hypothetical protein KAR42_11845 [candidate division Zixibacteria bacterium]|nr:hypothetical protein [candidate division Zixibacteria bacterium]